MKNEKSSSSLLSKWKNREKKEAASPLIPKAPKGAVIPLSSGQQRLWFLQGLYPKNPFYNISAHYTFLGTLEVEHIKRGLRQIIADHELLRSSYPMEADGPIMKIWDGREAEVDEIDLSPLPEEVAEDRARTVMSEQSATHFNLAEPPLLRISLLKFNSSKHVLFLTMHHIIADEWSMDILKDELGAHYRALCEGREMEAKTSEIDFSDYSYWQQGQSDFGAQLAYWREKLSGEIPVLGMHTDHAPPAVPTYRGRLNIAEYPEDLSKKVQELARELGVTPFVLLLGVYYVFLYKYTGQRTLLVGSPISNRDQGSLEGVFGFFIDTMVLKSEVDADESFAEFARKVQNVALDAFLHKDVPFNLLVKELKIKRSLAVNPFFRVMFVYNPDSEVPSFGKDVQLIDDPLYDPGVSKFDLTLYLTERDGKLSSVLEYATDLFKGSTIDQFQEHLRLLLENVVADPNRLISDLKMQTPREKALFFSDTPENEGPFAKYQGIHDLIVDSGKKNPAATAVVFGDETITYSELLERADAIAGTILGLTKGRNEIVGLYVDRSLEMIVGLLAILRAGCAYLPIDPEYPAQRVHFMLKDSKVNIVLTQKTSTSNFGDFDGKRISIEGAFEDQSNAEMSFPDSNGENLAYVIYTSGSMGNPKGVPITHRNIINSTEGRLTFYDGDPQAFLLLSSIAFDSSKAGIFWTLCTGGKLVVSEKRIEQDIEKLCDLVFSNGVTHTLMLPSLYQLVLEYGTSSKLQGLTTAIVAGEACPATLGPLHFGKLPKAGLYNEYGPTEATVWCTAHEVSRNQKGDSVPIGKPVAKANIMLLNDSLEPVPLGAVGEIYIGGPGLSGHYLNRPDLTKKAYVQTPFKGLKTDRLYKTGDRGRYNEQGDLEFLGRMDQQVKIRGFRIELDGIEKTILESGLCDETVVLVEHVQTDGGMNAVSTKPEHLVAYIVPRSTFDKAVLKSYLVDHLPTYMVPAHFIPLESFPKLPNGKVDKKALGSVKRSLMTKDRGAVQHPKNEIEKKLAAIWEEVLKISPIGTRDNFFELGGDSISSIQIMAKARKAGLQLKTNQLFENQTIAELALFAKTEDVSKLKTENVVGEVPLTPIQHWFFELHQAAPHFWNQIVRISNSGSVHFSVLERLTNELVAYHDALRLSFVRIDNTWKARVLPLDALKCFYRFDVGDLPDRSAQNRKIDGTMATLQGQCDLGKDNLFRMVYFDCGQTQTNQVFFVAHHLVVDMVSWNAIFSDFSLGMEQLKSGQKIDFKPKTTSIRAWGEQLLEIAQSDKIREELPFWEAQNNNTALSTDFGKNTQIYRERDIKTHSSKLGGAMSKLLLSGANEAYNTKVEDLLVTALMITVREREGLEHCCIGLERHGRTMNYAEIDVSNTIGWFTSFFPLKLRSPETTDIGGAIKMVKEHLRAIPNDGIGFGILKYLSDQNARPDFLKQDPQMVFNYLGNVGGSYENSELSYEFQSHGNRDALSERTYALEINAYVGDGLLHVDWSYSTEAYEESKLLALVEDYLVNLEKLIAHCTSEGVGNYTPSDFPEAGLSQDELDDLMNLL